MIETNAIETLTTFAADYTSQITSAAPIVIGVAVAWAGLNVGVKIVKKLLSKVA